jgi:hypothetical protein
LVRIAIVGLGPWGVCALERIVSSARQGLSAGSEILVDVIEPATPGSGIYDVKQPDYLLLNNPCGQLSLYPFASEDDQPCYGVGLYDWAVARGYRWVDDRCAIGRSGDPIEPHHFLPRRLMGEYLQWFYRALLAGAPSCVKIFHHQSSAVDIVSRRGGAEEVFLSDGTSVLADHVIVTSGHTANHEPAAGSVPTELVPYPVDPYVEGLPAGANVAVSGMGLVAVDVMIALTIGRGGRFVERGDRLEYRPSGSEPTINMFSISGLCFTAKSVTGVDRTDVYQPLICTPQELDALSGRNNGHRRAVDVRTELLPLLFAEMSARYYAQVAYQAGSVGDAVMVREQLRSAWGRGEFHRLLDRLAGRYGRFDAEALFFGRQPRYSSSEDYEQFVYSSVAADLKEAEVPHGYSPQKSAAEVFRIFRDPMRTVVEQGGLSLDSYLDFNADITSRIHRLVAGPPALRSRQLLALMDAGLVRTPFGPAPARGPALDEVGRRPDAPARTRISSTGFERPYASDMDYVIRGHLDEPRIDGSASELLTRLNRRGRVSQFRYGSVSVGSVDLTADSHPIDLRGRVQEHIWIFGVLTEGVRHFTQYIPSPKSRIRAFEELGTCIAEITGVADLVAA